MRLRNFRRFVQRRGATTPATAKSANRRVLLRRALQMAESDLKDDEAVDELREQAQSNSRAARRALKLLRPMRGEFVGDRAYRLLAAATNDAPVEVVDADRRTLFTRERELSDRPIVDAIEQLIHLEPTLRAVLPENQPSDETTRQVASIVGPGSSHKDPLVRSQLAISIVSHYLAIREGNTQLGNLSTPYRSAPRKVVVRATPASDVPPDPPMVLS